MVHIECPAIAIYVVNNSILSDRSQRLYGQKESLGNHHTEWPQNAGVYFFLNRRLEQLSNSLRLHGLNFAFHVKLVATIKQVCRFPFLHQVLWLFTKQTNKQISIPHSIQITDFSDLN